MDLLENSPNMDCGDLHSSQKTLTPYGVRCRECGLGTGAFGRGGQGRKCCLVNRIFSQSKRLLKINKLVMLRDHEIRNRAQPLRF